MGCGWRARPCSGAASGAARSQTRSEPPQSRGLWEPPSLGSVSQTAAQFCAAEIFSQWYGLSVNPPRATAVSAAGLILRHSVRDAWFVAGSFSLPNWLPRKSRNQVCDNQWLVTNSSLCPHVSKITSLVKKCQQMLNFFFIISSGLLLLAQDSDTYMHTHTHTHTFSLFPYRLLQKIEYNSLGPCWLSVLYIVVCMC